MNPPTHFLKAVEEEEANEYTLTEFFNCLHTITEAENRLIFDISQTSVNISYKALRDPERVNYIIADATGKRLPMRIVYNWDEFAFWARDKARGLE